MSRKDTIGIADWGQASKQLVSTGAQEYFSHQDTLGPFPSGNPG
jgi:hypothetical protein